MSFNLLFLVVGGHLFWNFRLTILHVLPVLGGYEDWVK